MKIKIPVSELRKTSSFDKIKEALQKNPKDAYTISGLLVEVLGIKKADIENKTFSDWPKGVPSKYTKVRLYLEKLCSQGLVKRDKHERAWVYYWSNKNEKLQQ